MKKNLLLLMSLIALISCQQISETNQDEQIQRTKYRNAEEHDYHVSLNEVNLFASCHCKEGGYTITPLTKSADTLLFIVNYDDGWMIVAGDKRVAPTLAEGPEGNIDLDSAPEGLSVWIDSMAEDISKYREFSSVEENENTRFWQRFSPQDIKVNAKECMTRYDPPVEKWYAITYQPELLSETSWDSIPHLIPIKWGQGYPWNSKCPIDTKVSTRCYLGCTATALGQMVYYMHYNLNKPNQLYHYITCTKTTVNGKTQDIGFVRDSLFLSSTRWNDMAVNWYGSSSGIEYAGDLMLDIGNRLGMKYSGEGSGASLSTSAISNYYNLSYTEDDYSFAPVLSNLLDSLPVISIAYSERGWLGLSYSGGHTWIIDGIHCVTRHYRTITEFECSENWMNHLPAYDTFEELALAYGIQDPHDQIIDYFSTDFLYLLMNWGYDGSFDNGYYGTYPTDDWFVGSTNYQYKRKIYYDFQ